MKRFKGIFTALLTPFGADGKINEKVLAEHIEANIKQGVSGFYVNGSTAEVFLLSEEERKYLYRFIKEAVGDRCTLIAHVGSVGTLQTIEYGKLAEKLGYDAISSVAPFYYNFSLEEIKQHYFATVDHVNLPMIVYNFPKFSGVSFSREDFAEFLRDDRFLGIKHTSSDFFVLEQLKTDFPDKVIYNGYDEMFLSGIAMGADGGIGSTYNFMADKFIKIKALFDAGQVSEAQRVQREVNKIIAALCKVGVMQGEKAILTLMGYDFGNARPPYRKLSKEDVEFLERSVLPLL
ncbi:MAG: N-acetylneuraminate lyase [Lachnospiraceae bacterium]|nr:N-acetylneuraminate lyase [Lachnospiraceae bacterium]